MKKKVIASLIAIVLTVVVIAAVVSIAVSRHYSVEMQIPTIMNRDRNYITTPMVFGTGMQLPKIEELVTEYGDVTNKFLDEFLEENKGKEYKIECEITITDDTTTVRYFGPITDPETDKTVEFEKEFVFDFIFDKKQAGFHDSSVLE